MPIYEYRCNACKKRFTIFCKISEKPLHPECEHCGSDDTVSLISKVRRVRDEEEIMESLADPTNFASLDENDPKSMLTWAKKMARELGEDMDEEIEQMAEEEFAKSDSCEDSEGCSSCKDLSDSSVDSEE